jgi:hypothetical protein
MANSKPRGKHRAIGSESGFRAWLEIYVENMLRIIATEAISLSINLPGNSRGSIDNHLSKSIGGMKVGDWRVKPDEPLGIFYTTYFVMVNQSYVQGDYQGGG